MVTVLKKYPTQQICFLFLFKVSCLILRIVPSDEMPFKLKIA